MCTKIERQGIISWVLAVFFSLLLITHRADAGSDSENYRLKVEWVTYNQTQELKSWSLSDLIQLKKMSSKEKDPTSGKVIRWDGFLLSHLLDKALDGQPAEKKAQIDLVILRSSSGARAMIPRALIVKYPILLAFLSDQAFGGRGPLSSIVPWTSKPRILDEDLPLENYFLSQVDRIQLSSYREQYSSLYLKRRTDPSAMRGEKLFVQNCVACHSMKQGSTVVGILDDRRGGDAMMMKHPSMKATAKLKERDWRSIGRYLDAHRIENPSARSEVVRSGR